MASVLLPHTWSVHSVSAFTKPHTLGFRTSNNTTSQPEAWAADRSLQQDATSHIQKHCQQQRQRELIQQKGKSKKTYDDDGDYVRIQWFQQEETQAKHCYVQVCVQETFAAALLFCFASSQQTSRVNQADLRITGFECCLVRGRRSYYEVMCTWLEALAGCSISRQAIGPSPTELSHTVAAMTRQVFLSQRQASNKTPPTDNANDEYDLSSTPSMTVAASKPLVMTFQVPAVVAGKGIDTLSITIPPSALFRLCEDIEKARPKRTEEDSRRRPKRPRVDVGDGASGHAQVALDNWEEPDKDCDTYSTEDNTVLPLLRAMQCYIREAFHIELATFSLVKVSSGVAMIGCDGRCKIVCRDMVSHVLMALSKVVQRRFERSKDAFDRLSDCAELLGEEDNSDECSVSRDKEGVTSADDGVIA